MEQKNLTTKKISKKKLSDYLQMDKKDQTSVLVFLIALVCLALGYFVFLPAVDGYKKARIDTENLSADKTILLQEQTNLESLKKDISERSDFISKTEDAMPTTAEIPELLISLSKFANDNSLYITNFSPKEVTSTASTGASETENPANPAQKLNYNTVEVDFDISGSYLSLKQFILDVETNIRPINIVSISVSGGGEINRETSSEVLRFSIKANVYYEKQK